MNDVEIYRAIEEVATGRALDLVNFGVPMDMGVVGLQSRKTAARLAYPDDDERAHAADALARLCWPEGTRPPFSWWATPLGRVIAATHPAADQLATDGAGLLQREAAEMLGISRNTVMDYIGRGYLARDDDGRIRVIDVIERIARLWAKEHAKAEADG